MTHKEKAEAYVRQQLPELMKLSFGCEVKIKKDATIGPFRILGSGWGSDFECQYFYKEGIGHNSVGQKISDITEIIGHPIQLSHVLRLVHEDLQSEALSNWDLYKPWEQQHEGLYQWLCEHWHI